MKNLKRVKQILILLYCVFLIFLMGCSSKGYTPSSGVKEKVTVGGITFYGPLTTKEVDSMSRFPGYDLEYTYRYNSNYHWAQYDWKVGSSANGEGDSKATVETYAKARGLSVPTVEELEKLYKKFPDGAIQSQLGWPSGNYWTDSLDSNGNHLRLNFGEGQVESDFDENQSHTDFCVILVK